MKITHIILHCRHILSVVTFCLSFTFSQAQTYSNQLYQRAQSGSVEAQCKLGFCYYKGEGVTKDYSKAAYWFRKAADQGSAMAQYILGLCYKEGMGVTKDYSQVAYWLRKAADKGLAEAQSDLGLCYENGDGVTKDYSKAAYWYRKAADKGLAVAQYNLGNCYKFGEGVKQDYTQAVYWYRKAADQGYAPAQFQLGVMYNLGFGVTKDNAKAVYWLKKAAEQGDEEAKNYLILIEMEGYEDASKKNSGNNPAQQQTLTQSPRAVFHGTRVGKLAHLPEDSQDKYDLFVQCNVSVFGTKGKQVRLNAYVDGPTRGKGLYSPYSKHKTSEGNVAIGLNLNSSTDSDESTWPHATAILPFSDLGLPDGTHTINIRWFAFYQGKVIGNSEFQTVHFTKRGKEITNFYVDGGEATPGYY